MFIGYDRPLEGLFTALKGLSSPFEDQCNVFKMPSAMLRTPFEDLSCLHLFVLDLQGH